jgi:hypothetical protein
MITNGYPLSISERLSLMTHEELRQRIIDKYDATDLIETLGINIEQVVDAFWDQIEKDNQVFEDILGPQYKEVTHD